MADLSDYMTAAEAVDRLALQYQNMVVASAALRDLGRFKQIKTEAEAAQAKATEMIREAGDEKARAAAELAEARTLASQIVADANVLAQAIRDEAESAAVARRAEADAEASRAIQAARASADRITGNAQETLARLQSQIDEASEDIVRLNADKDTIRLEVEAAERQLQVARDAVRNLMGGA